MGATSVKDLGEVEDYDVEVRIFSYIPCGVKSLGFLGGYKHPPPASN